MAKLGTRKKPVRFRARTEERLQELAAICDEHNWQFVGGLEPDQPEDIREIEYMLNPGQFIVPPRMKQTENQPIEYIEEKTGRNDPCPCGSGKKFKKCCM